MHTHTHYVDVDVDALTTMHTPSICKYNVCSFLCASKMYSIELMEIFTLKIAWKLRHEEDRVCLRTNEIGGKRVHEERDETNFSKRIYIHKHMYARMFQV